MSFACPNCQRPDSLAITHKLELPPDGRSDEITLQIIACEDCAFRGMAVYEESRRGASESWRHDGYHVAPADVAQLALAISQCDKNSNHRCDCPTHQLYGKANQHGRWQFPFTIIASFNMNWHKGGL